VGAARPFLIGNQWRQSATTATIRNPYNGKPVADVCLAGKAEADEAAARAVEAFPAMRLLPAHARAEALLKIAGRLAIRQDEIARTMTAESGKPIADARREVGRAVQTFTIAAEEAKRIPGDVIPMDLTPGMGEKPKVTDKVKVHYTGTLVDGTVFDSSVQRGEPATLPLNGVIKCWAEGIPQMKIGGKAKLVCPPEVAYGDRGAPPRIKPGATIVFEVELLEIVK